MDKVKANLVKDFKEVLNKDIQAVQDKVKVLNKVQIQQISMTLID